MTTQDVSLEKILECQIPMFSLSFSLPSWLRMDLRRHEVPRCKWICSLILLFYRSLGFRASSPTTTALTTEEWQWLTLRNAYKRSRCNISHFVVFRTIFTRLRFRDSILLRFSNTAVLVPLMGPRSVTPTPGHHLLNSLSIFSSIIKSRLPPSVCIIKPNWEFGWRKCWFLKKVKVLKDKWTAGGQASFYENMGDANNMTRKVKTTFCIHHLARG